MKAPLPNPKSHLLLLFLLTLAASANGFGSMGPISASFGDHSLFCAIDASGKHAVIYWDADNSYSTTLRSSQYSITLPPMTALSGGDGFLCGILADISQALCWDSMGAAKTTDLILDAFKLNAYSHIPSDKDHVSAIRGSYFSENVTGAVYYWDIVSVQHKSSSKQSFRFYDQTATASVYTKVVSGNGFRCGAILNKGITCWGPNSDNLRTQSAALASIVDSICGVSQISGEIKCWGNNTGVGTPPTGIRLVSLAAGARHFCGIRENNHGVECWGSFNSSLIPKGAGFLSIASSEWLTCGIREGDMRVAV